MGRVPAERVTDLPKEFGITKTHLAQAAGKSSSLLAEWTGKSRGMLMAEASWPVVEAAARAFAKGAK